MAHKIIFDEYNRIRFDVGYNVHTRELIDLREYDNILYDKDKVIRSKNTENILNMLNDIYEFDIQMKPEKIN